MKALLHTLLHRTGHMQVTCLLEYQKGSCSNHYTWKDTCTYLRMGKPHLPQCK